MTSTGENGTALHRVGVDSADTAPYGDLEAAVPATDESIARTAEVFKALATPSRLRILLVLCQGPSSVTNIVDETHLSQPLVSQHLKLLRGLQLVAVERSGREAIYALKDDHVAHVILDAIAHSSEAEH